MTRALFPVSLLIIALPLAFIASYDWIGYQMQYEVEWSKHGPRLCNIPPHGDCTYLNDIEPIGGQSGQP